MVMVLPALIVRALLMDLQLKTSVVFVTVTVLLAQRKIVRALLVDPQ